ncbi:hypothetical protein J2T16_005770 [Paenibacillus intestini]|nr:hypothetical protein [Paenibacillus intestini]
MSKESKIRQGQDKVRTTNVSKYMQSNMLNDLYYHRDPRMRVFFCLYFLLLSQIRNGMVDFIYHFMNNFNG